MGKMPRLHRRELLCTLRSNKGPGGSVIGELLMFWCDCDASVGNRLLILKVYLLILGICGSVYEDED